MGKFRRALGGLSPRARVGWLAAAVAIGVLAVAKVVYQLHDGQQPAQLVVDVLGYVLAAAAGLAAWARRPDSRVGVILVLWGLANLSEGIGRYEIGVLLLWWYVSQIVTAVLFARALLTYPDGRPETRGERLLLRVAYAISVLWLLYAMVSPSGWIDNTCAMRSCPQNPLLVVASQPAAWTLWGAQKAVSAGCAVWFTVLLIRRYRRMSPSRRRTVAPVIWAAGGPILQFCLQVALSSALTTTPWLWTMQSWLSSIVNWWVPIAMVGGLLATRLARADVAAMLVRLRSAPADDLQPALARVLRDPHLEIAIPAPDAAGDAPTGYINPGGGPVLLPGDTDERVGTDIGHGMLLLHHPSTRTEDPQLFDAAVATARLTLDNARLTAQVRAQLAEVSASRERIMRAADDERRRLERDLHDGAQQRLIGLGMALGHARGTVDDTSPTAHLLDEATDHLRESITELKSLARGLRPALLAERGLAVALQTLLRHVSVPTTLSVELPTRPDATVETAAYFVIAEALQNVTRHAPQARAAVTVRGHGERLVVTVSDDGPGGVDNRAGTGLRGLTDRVTATGGRLAVTSVPDVGTTITAELPLHTTAARPRATDDPGPHAPPRHGDPPH